jgi:hypothetical protein
MWYGRMNYTDFVKEYCKYGNTDHGSMKYKGVTPHFNAPDKECAEITSEGLNFNS